MDTITINIRILEDDDLCLAFEPGEEIKIKTAGDIDLSEYVEKLTFLIDKRPKIILNKAKTEKPKLKLVQKIINDIITSFNGIIEEQGDEI